MRAATVTKRDDRGFTLVETLIVVVLLSVIVPVLGLAFNTMLAQTATTQNRLEVSHDAQLANAYFAEDVASIGVRDGSGGLLQSVETNAPATGGKFPCGPGTLPNASVRFAWDELSGGSTEVRTRVVVSYVIVPDGAERQLRRVVCRTTPAPESPTPTAPIVDQVVAHHVSATTAPTLSCWSSASTDCVGATPPNRVSLGLTIAYPDDPEPLTVTLTGQRRQT